MRVDLFAAAALVLAAGSAAAQTPAQPPAQPPAGYPKMLPTPSGEVIIPGPGGQRAHDEIHFAPARRAGDALYISGVIVGPAAQEGRDKEAFRLQARRAFTAIQRTLQAAGLTFADVTMINSYHVWNGPGFKGTRDEQFQVLSSVKDEFMSAPHAAWTAVGTTGLLADDGVVEIQMIAHAPAARRR